MSGHKVTERTGATGAYIVECRCGWRTFSHTRSGAKAARRAHEEEA